MRESRSGDAFPEKTFEDNYCAHSRGAKYQCRIKVGAVNAAALGHSRNRPTATDEKKDKSSLFWL